MMGRGRGGWRWTIGLALGTGLVASVAGAQVKSPAVVLDDAQLFHPATDPSRFVSVYDTRNLDPGRYTLGLYGNYAKDPILLQLEAADRRSSRLVKTVAGAELVGALGLTDRFTLGVGIPYIYTDNRRVLSLGQPTEDGGHFLGDVSLEAKITLVPRPIGQGFGFSLLPRVIFPTGNRKNFAGTGEFSGGGLLIADWRYSKINYGVNVGGFIRDGVGRAHGRGDKFDDTFNFGAGVTVPTGKYLDLIGELNGRTGYGGERNTPLEGLLAFRFHNNTIAFTVGGGGGFTSGRGAPQFRIIASITPYIPEKEIPPPRADLLTNSRKTWALAVDVDNDGRPNPGDTLEYTINLVNSGTKAAEEVVFVDPVPEHVTYVPGSMVLNGTALTDEADGDAADFNAANAGAVTVKVPNIPSPDPATPAATNNAASFSFRVLIDPEIVDLTVVRNEATVYHKDQPAADGSDNPEGPRMGERLAATETTVFPRIRERETVVVTPDKLELTRNIHFEFDKATIRTESYSILNDVAAVLQENPQLNILIEGHTDSVGGVEYNQKLSNRRADSVRKYLIGKGVEGKRLATDGKGKLQPIASNETPVGRAMNRRVEFLIVNPAVLEGRRVEKRPYVEDITPESEPPSVSGRDMGLARGANKDVLEVQESLAKIGYLSAPATGIMTAETKAALERFQRENGLPVTGAPDDITRKALDEAVELQHSAH